MEINRNSINSVSSSPIVNGIVNQTDANEQVKFEKLLESAKNEKDSAKLEKVCKDLEGVFLTMIFKQMNNSVEKSKLFDDGSGGFAGGMFKDMLTEKYAEEASNGNGVGIAKMLFKQLSSNSKLKSEVAVK